MWRQRRFDADQWVLGGWDLQCYGGTATVMCFGGHRQSHWGFGDGRNILRKPEDSSKNVFNDLF